MNLTFVIPMRPKPMGPTFFPARGTVGDRLEGWWLLRRAFLTLSMIFVIEVRIGI